MSDKGRTEELKTFLRRLADGEALETVRADFVQDFREVDASEIMQAEQELIQEGTPLPEVQKLCDLHSALFHGATKEERIANAEKAVEASVNRQAGGNLKSADVQSSSSEAHAKAGISGQPGGFPVRDYSDKNARAAALEQIPGHPLSTLTRENEALQALIDAYRQNSDPALLPKIREVAGHYAKKGDLLYPLLKVRYGVSGPSEVMWSVDIEIRNALGTLARDEKRDGAWNIRVLDVLRRAEEMIYKEQNILFPICAVNFTEDEWRRIAYDMKDYDNCFGVVPEKWAGVMSEQEASMQSGMHTDRKTSDNSAADQSASASGAAQVPDASVSGTAQVPGASASGTAQEAGRSASSELSEGEVVMPGGCLKVAELTALLNTIPMEISFVDTENINRYFNEGPKVFKRPSSALGREVFSCHPPKVEPMVRQIIDDFRNGRRDEVPVWMEKGGRTMLVRYMAVRSREGQYLGTMELVQDMEFAKEHFAKQ